MSYKLECAVWEFTLKCNLRCSHCGSSAGTARPDELTTKECIKLCEDLAELGCSDVSLMGGEPFLRDDWTQIAQCITDLGMNLNFVSNGLLIDKYIDDIAKHNPKVIGISLDGTEKTHDRIRGKIGAYKKAIDSIDMLIDRGIQTTAITTVSKMNFDELHAIKDVVYKKGCNWQIQVAMPFGNFDKKYLITKEEYYAVALFIASQRIKTSFDDLPVIGAHCFGYHSKILPGCHGWKGCTAGMKSIGITSDGGILGCLSMGNNCFIEGNIKDTPLKQIWQDPDAFRYNRKFKKTDFGPNCKDCKHGAKCKGGCNSVSQTITKQFHNNPYCFYAIEKDIIKIR
ncbi:MAG: radical SAM protein [archaeon]